MVEHPLLLNSYYKTLRSVRYSLHFQRDQGFSRQGLLKTCLTVMLKPWQYVFQMKHILNDYAIFKGLFFKLVDCAKKKHFLLSFKPSSAGWFPKFIFCNFCAALSHPICSHHVELAILLATTFAFPSAFSIVRKMTMVILFKIIAPSSGWKTVTW